MKITEETGLELRKQRKQRLKLTLKQVASRSGISHAHLSDIERGKAEPSHHTLLSILVNLRVHSEVAALALGGGEADFEILEDNSVRDAGGLLFVPPPGVSRGGRCLLVPSDVEIPQGETPQGRELTTEVVLPDGANMPLGRGDVIVLPDGRRIWCDAAISPHVAMDKDDLGGMRLWPDGSLEFPDDRSLKWVTPEQLEFLEVHQKLPVALHAPAIALAKAVVLAYAGLPESPGPTENLHRQIQGWREEMRANIEHQRRIAEDGEALRKRRGSADGERKVNKSTSKRKCKPKPKGGRNS